MMIKLVQDFQNFNFH